MKRIKLLRAIIFLITSICNAQLSFNNYALYNLNVIDVNSKQILQDYSIIISYDKIVDLLPTQRKLIE